jgi:hypothetical protein
MAEARTLISGVKEIVTTNTGERVVTESTVITGALLRADKANKANVKVATEVSATSGFLEAGESLSFDAIDLSRISVFGKEKDLIVWFGAQP